MKTNEECVRQGYILINGIKKKVFPNDPTDVFVCNKYDDLKFLSGSWFPRYKYEEREKWFPYDESDRPKHYCNSKFNKETHMWESEDYYILHEPMYFDTDGNQLPGNRSPENLPQQKIIDVKEYNYYTDESFITVAIILIILCILASIFINGGWGTWLFLIPYLIYRYNKWIKYINMIK